MIRPEDLKNLDKKNIQEIIEKIDESIKKHHGWYPWEIAVIGEEYSKDIRNQIGKKYKEAGWTYVYHITSNENGERPGLTSFIFSQEDLWEKGYCKKYTMVE